jgi:caffeoyl-CoA O-methyltransferase
MILRPELVEYAAAHSTPPRDELVALTEATRALPAAGMITGPVVGRLLEALVWATQPALAVEVGTFTGFGALSMAAALPEGGRLVTCEVDPVHAAFARERFAASPFGDRIELVEGPALPVLEALDEPVGFAWLDGDKDANVDYYEALVPRLAPRGLIACDNTLRRGDVLDPADDMAAAVAAFNDHVAADPRTVQVLLPLSDGVTLVRRAEG